MIERPHGAFVTLALVKRDCAEGTVTPGRGTSSQRTIEHSTWRAQDAGWERRSARVTRSSRLPAWPAAGRATVPG
jgi:hypothetical protein